MPLFSSLTARFALAALVFTVAAVPAPAPAQDLPSYAQPSYATTDETIHGRIRSVDGAFTITVDDDRGFVDTVALHAGTIINPTGLSLAAGMSVTIQGYNAGGAFAANEIDTPYTYAGPLPDPVYYGPGYWYPGFDYGYGPSFALALVIVGGGYHSWHYDHQPFCGRPWNGHGYFGATVAFDPHTHAPMPRGPGATGVRYETGARTAGNEPAHEPAAFAGRSFAGESRGEAGGSSYVNETGSREFGTVETGGRAYGGAQPAYRHESAPGGERFGGEATRSGASARGGGSRESRGGASHGSGRAH